MTTVATTISALRSNDSPGWGSISMASKILHFLHAPPAPPYMKEDDFWNGELHDTVEAYGSSKKIQLIAQNAYYKQFGLKGNHLI